MIERFNFITEKIKTNQKISFDADGVLIDSATQVVNEFNKRFETTYRVKDIKDWNSISNWAIKKGTSKEDAEKLNFDMWTNPDLLYRAKPMPGSLEIYRSLLNISDFPIPIITVRNLYLREVTFDWFNRYLPEVPKKWINIRESNEIKGNDFKIKKISDNDIKWHFDDSAEIMALVLKKLRKTNMFFITNSSAVKPRKDRVVVIPSWEWSPELYS